MQSLKIKIIDGDTIDLDLTNNTGNMISDKEALCQNIYMEIKENKGQWYLNLNFGMPWVGIEGNIGVFDRKLTDKSIIEKYINNTLDTYSEIKSYKYTLSEISTSDRIYSAKIELNTIYGSLSLAV